MKICQVLCGRGTGGLERHFVDLCNSLAEHYEVIAVAHPEFGDRFNAQVRFEPLDLSGWRYRPLALLRLYGVLRRHRPDIVHAQANKAAAMAGVLRSVIRAKWVATIHNLKHNTRMFRGFDRVIAVSKRAAQQLSQSHVEVIYNGIEPPALPAETGREYLGKALNKEWTGPVVISVGRLVPAKGFDQLLRAWTEMEAALVIVGDGPERARLENMIRELGLGDRVMLAGHRRDAPALMASADLMVIASRNEGFPYVLVEGLHVRQVIVATQVPGVEDVLPADFLVDYGEPRQLAATIRGVLQDFEAARRAYIPVWEFAARELTLVRMVERTAQIYQEVLAAP